MTKMDGIRKKTDAELTELVNESRETLRTERFKDRFSRKAGVTRSAKLEIARALTELTSRRNKQDSK